MHRDAKEALVGLAMLLVFSIALVVWPPLGVYIHDAVQTPLDLISNFF
jgi:phosphotransferase system  glucose/maltose/N-acetylglucosamine-specific IIC component